MNPGVPASTTRNPYDLKANDVDYSLHFYGQMLADASRMDA